MGCGSSSIDVVEVHQADGKEAFQRKPKTKRSKQSATPVRTISLKNPEVIVSVARAPTAPARPVKPIAPPSPLPPGLPETGLPGEVDKGHQVALRETATAASALPAPPVGEDAPALRSPAAPATSGLVLLNPQRPAEEASQAAVVDDCSASLAEKSRSGRKELSPLKSTSSRPGTGMIASRPGTGGTGVSFSGVGGATRPGTGTSGSPGIGSPGVGGRPASRPATVASTTASTFGLFSPSSRGTAKEENMTDLFDEIEVAEDKAMAFELEGWMSGMRKTLLLDEDGHRAPPCVDGIKLCNPVAATPASQRMQALISGDDELLMQQILEDSDNSMQDESALF